MTLGNFLIIGYGISFFVWILVRYLANQIETEDEDRCSIPSAIIIGLIPGVNLLVGFVLGEFLLHHIFEHGGIVMVKNGIYKIPFINKLIELNNKFEGKNDS
mgnify:CR=1 FL=1